jgi:hypothetical protein
MIYCPVWGTPDGLSKLLTITREKAGNNQGSSGALGVETIESCEGGPGHAFPEPTVRLAGGKRVVS